MTPRKPRNRQNHAGPSQLYQVQGSDYDTEPPIAAPRAPSPTPSVKERAEAEARELTLKVLKRYHPSIQRIMSIAGSARMYMFSLESKTWEKLNIEGALFVCELFPSPTTGAEDYCIVILNRKGINNVIYDLSEMNNVEINGEYLYWTVEKPETVGGTPVAKAFGLFIYDDEMGTRDANLSEILSKWQRTRATMTDVQTMENKVENYGEKGPREADNTIPGHIPTQTEVQGGRRLSITDLFGGR